MSLSGLSRRSGARPGRIVFDYRMSESQNVLPFLLTESLDPIRGLDSRDSLLDLRDSIAILQSMRFLQEHPEH
jgi:hypothetical protein